MVRKYIYSYIIRVDCDVYSIFYSTGNYLERQIMKDLNNHSKVRLVQDSVKVDVKLMSI